MLSSDNAKSRGFTVWFTGLSGAGKSTLARALGHVLDVMGYRVEILDGDDIRRTLSSDLGFSALDRAENTMRLGFIARLLSRNGVAVIVAAISPYRASRHSVRQIHERPFVEVFVDCDLAELIRRDEKGLYARALKGEISHFTGISDPYEPPLVPDIHLRTGNDSVQTCVDQILETLKQRNVISPP